MKLSISINLNENVEVELSEVGKQVYAKYYQGLSDIALKFSGKPLSEPPPTKLKVQLWDLMRIFGPELHAGTFTPFVDSEITISKER